MTSLFEFEAKNVEKAVDKACEELKIPRDEIRYDILSHGFSGIFGLAGAKKARIRVHLAETAAKEFDIPDKAYPAAADGLTGDSSLKAPTVMNAGSDAMVLYSFPDNPLDLGRSVLQRIVDSITSGASISTNEDADRIFFNVVGGNAAILIGKKGQTLEAIQSLVEKVVNKHDHHNHKIRVQVDVEGYLETRKANLENLALRLADKAQRIGKPISLGEMSAHDRRIVHLALKDHLEVRTQSRGEGYLRKLIIFPNQNHKPLTHQRSSR
jgi:spoIIIJ-associated protein